MALAADHACADVMEVSMQMIVAVVKPNKVEAVKSALIELGVLGMTALESKGFAKQLGHNERYRGPKLDAGWVPKLTVFVCVKDTDREAVVQAIIAAAKTGSVGDGKVFTLPLSEVVRIRTGELNEAAL
ncbi:MAG TPA: P-II family nitrogen regulator [Tepidisphaeraceae bacterium]|nr:P-II family nitrogen regulator [Tepidisphaeraceae bacterium]